MNQNTINIKIEPVFSVYGWWADFDVESLDKFCENVKNLSPFEMPYHFHTIRRIFQVADVDLPTCKANFDLRGGGTKKAPGHKKHTLDAEVIVARDRVPTVKDLIVFCRKNRVRYEEDGCELCRICCHCSYRLPENQDKPAFWDGHNNSICYLNPDEHLVVSQQDCRQLFPTPDEKHPVAPNGMPQKLVDFFNAPINVSLGLNMALTENVLNSKGR